MEYFDGGGGSSNPYFINQVKVKKVSDEMWQWCNDYELPGHFSRWYVHWGHSAAPYDIVQFEREEPALMFALKFGHL